MRPARIAELLAPFMAAFSFSAGSEVRQRDRLSKAGDSAAPCHSDRSRSASDGAVEEPAVLITAPTENACHAEGASASEVPAVLSPSQLHDISTYIDLLERWNARINLTAIRNPEEVVTRHFGESLFAARHLFPTTTNMGTPTAHVGTAALGCLDEQSSAAAGTNPSLGAVEHREEHGVSRAEAISKKEGTSAPGNANDQRPTANDRITVADLGSGAGFPGLPIKLWAPEISLTLIESNHKKATFLREVTRALTLTNVNIQTARAETLSGIAFDVVTLRAVERFESIVPVAARMVAPGGRLALLLGSAQLEASATQTPPDFSWARPEPIPASKSRMLVIATRR
jgi:16S rRNA (guanine(527)-N(7))-methyltransferase RsmG